MNLIYLTPFFPARSNHRYNATSFDVVDPLLGGDDALAELVAVAHDRGFKVIGDLTSNHSGDTHEWFEAAHRNTGRTGERVLLLPRRAERDVRLLAR